jgi:hypothetical protein
MCHLAVSIFRVTSSLMRIASHTLLKILHPHHPNSLPKFLPLLHWNLWGVPMLVVLVLMLVYLTHMPYALIWLPSQFFLCLPCRLQGQVAQKIPLGHRILVLILERMLAPVPALNRGQTTLIPQLRHRLACTGVLRLHRAWAHAWTPLMGGPAPCRHVASTWPRVGRPHLHLVARPTQIRPCTGPHLRWPSRPRLPRSRLRT